MTARRPPTALPLPDARRDFLAGFIDDAQLLAPDAPPLPVAVASFRATRTEPAAAVMGRFTCPATRLVDLAGALSSTMTAVEAPWPITVVLDGDLGAAATAAQSFDAVMDPAARILLGTVPITPAADAVALESIIAAAARATTAAPFGTAALLDLADHDPGQSAAIAGFVATCHRTQTPFVAAGLDRMVTDQGTLGILNLVVATALVAGGAADKATQAALNEVDPAAFHFSRTGLVWREYTVGAPSLRRLRATALQSIAAPDPRKVVEELGQAHVPKVRRDA